MAKPLNMWTHSKNINFYVDSQSAIKALQSYTTFMKSVLECKKLVNKVGEANTICINWIPGHTGQLGNEIADRLAKLGADMEADGAEPRVAISQCVIKSATEKWFRNRQDQDWQNRVDCRQTKLVLPATGHRWGQCTKYLNRNEMRILTQIATGHGCLQRHKFNMGLVDRPNCELCGEETDSHTYCHRVPSTLWTESTHTQQTHHYHRND